MAHTSRPIHLTDDCYQQHLPGELDSRNMTSVETPSHRTRIAVTSEKVPTLRNTLPKEEVPRGRNGKVPPLHQPACTESMYSKWSRRIAIPSCSNVELLRNQEKRKGANTEQITCYLNGAPNNYERY
jgi:hypothetical protein